MANPKNNPPANEPEEQNEEIAPVVAAKAPVYLFTHKEPKGAPRTFEVDAERVQTFMGRADLKYIGDIPLPKKR